MILAHYDRAGEGCKNAQLGNQVIKIPDGCEEAHLTATPKQPNSRDANDHSFNLTWYIGMNCDTNEGGCVHAHNGPGGVYIEPAGLTVRVGEATIFNRTLHCTRKSNSFIWAKLIEPQGTFWVGKPIECWQIEPRSAPEPNKRGLSPDWPDKLPPLPK
jgi:hypothetical protein